MLDALAASVPGRPGMTAGQAALAEANALAVLDPHGTSAASHWAAYVRTWTAWNHVRCAASLVVTGLLTTGVITS